MLSLAVAVVISVHGTVPAGSQTSLVSLLARGWARLVAWFQRWL